MKKEVREIFDIIAKFEMEQGESFNDCFSHDNISDNSWAFFLMGKGHVEHGNKIIDEKLKGNTCIDQELLYHVKPTGESDLDIKENYENWEYNMTLMAEFLAATQYYTIKFYFWNEKNCEE